MAGYIEDRWLKKKPNPDTGKRERTSLWGKCKRYRVKGIPGVPDRSFDRASDAKDWQDEASTDTGRGQFVDPRRGDITLADYFEKHWWPSLRVPPSTRETMEARIRGHILPHLGKKPLRAIGTDEVNAWVVVAEKKLNPNTVRTSWQHLSSILQAAVEAKRIGVNPCRGHSTARPPAKPKQKARALDQETMARVRAGLRPRYRVLVDIGVGSALRQGEAFGLSPDDLRDGELNVVRQVLRIKSRLCFGPPKGNKERKLPLAPGLAAAIQAHMEEFPPVEVELPWVDPDRPSLEWEDRPKQKVLLLNTTIHGNAINRTDWNQKSWKPALMAAGLISRVEGSHLFEESREFGFHLTRHTFASVMLESGESVVTLAHWLGHADPAFTLRTYTHFMPQAGSRGFAALDAWLGPEGLKR